MINLTHIQDVALLLREPALGAKAEILLFIRSSQNTASQIIRLTAYSPATINNAIAELIDHGFVTREPDPQDRRSKILSLTFHAESVLKLQGLV
jgi:hypothetical protein